MEIVATLIGFAVLLAVLIALDARKRRKENSEANPLQSELDLARAAYKSIAEELKREQGISARYARRLILAFGEGALLIDESRFVAYLAQVNHDLARAKLIDQPVISQVKQ